MVFNRFLLAGVDQARENVTVAVLPLLEPSSSLHRAFAQDDQSLKRLLFVILRPIMGIAATELGISFTLRIAIAPRRSLMVQRKAGRSESQRSALQEITPFHSALSRWEYTDLPSPVELVVVAGA
jgi:hypothetical protein